MLNRTIGCCSLQTVRLSEFIDQLLLHPTKELASARKAFLASYTGVKGKNQFTKVRMGREADESLQRYFQIHEDRLSRWFNVIALAGQELTKPAHRT